MTAMVDEKTEQKDRSLAYGILRLALGVNLLGHDVVRLVGGAGGFVNWMVEHMNGTILPASMVRGFAYFLIVEELLVGVLLIVGWYTRAALVVGGLVMVTLTWGVVLKQDWATAGLQLSYSITFFLLLFFRRYDLISVDGWLRRKEKI
jgi:thiosulfate dehydrogenase (quinone) large subunit